MRGLQRFCGSQALRATIRGAGAFVVGSGRVLGRAAAALAVVDGAAGTRTYLSLSPRALVLSCAFVALRAQTGSPTCAARHCVQRPSCSRTRSSAFAPGFACPTTPTTSNALAGAAVRRPRKRRLVREAV